MSKEIFCPECGEKMAAEERFCQNCGAEFIAADETKNKKTVETPVVGAGARANIMGGVHQASTTNTNVNSSSVDNSSTVNHNTTYVMNEKKKEFCEVCGNPLEEKHAKCPKCGKEICMDCKVKGKARCVECEKKAVNEYRLAFQQLQLTTNGNIGVTGRQMMDQKARELDVEDVKASIEKDLIELYKPQNRAVQPDVVPNATVVENVETLNGAKGIGTLDGRTAIKPKTQGSGNKTWLVIVILVVAVGAYFLLNKESEKLPDSTKTEETTVTQPEKVETQQTEPIQKAEVKSVQVKQESEPPVVSEQPSKSEPVVVEVKKDANYDAGMKAYEAGNGLEAINAFKSSGSAKAYYMLGVIYEQGCGNVGKNAMMARKNFKKAAQMGSEEAKAKL